MRLDWEAQDVLRAVQGRSLHAQDWIAHGVSIDSRTAKPTDLFIAIKGPAQDGHEYVHKAFAAGASAAIVQSAPPQVPEDAPLIYVEDTFAALQALGRAGRARAQTKILAVTGSVGKTSSKELLRLALGTVKDTYANEGSLNNHWGVPLSLARLPQDAVYGVFEIGMNHAGELGPLAQEVRPDVALITNVEAVHLEHFGSVEAIADAKAEIFLGLSPSGTAVLNRDNPHYPRLLAAARAAGVKKCLGFGRDSKSDACLLSLSPDADGSNVEASVLGETILFRLGAPGEHLAINALGALLACAAAEADIDLCLEALAAYRPPTGRGTRRDIALPEGGRFALIDESFNASPVAVRAALNVLGETPAQGRRIAVLGDMKELGETAPALHTDLADDLRKNKIDKVFCCGEMMSLLYASLPEAMRGARTEDSAALAPFVATDVREGDVVTVKGSHSMHMEKIVEALCARGKAPLANRKRAC